MGRKPAPPGVDRRQQILDAALDVFAEQGFEGATSKAIAERAEVTHGLIYFYFNTKEELFQATFDHALEEALGHLDVEAVLGQDAPPDVVVADLLTRVLTGLYSPRAQGIARLMMHSMAHKERKTGPLHECRTHMKLMVERIFDELRAYLDGQVALGRLRSTDTALAAKFLLAGAVTALRWQSAMEGEALQPEAAAREMASLCMRGLLPRAEDTRAAESPAALVRAAPESEALG